MSDLVAFLKPQQFVQSAQNVSSGASAGGASLGETMASPVCTRISADARGSAELE